MKCSVISRPSWSASRSVLTVGTANLFCNLEGLGDSQVVIPIQLKYIKQRNGSLGKPLIDIRQPQYQEKSTGKYRTSYLTVHLTGMAVEQISKLITPEWLKGEIKRLMGTGIASDYEWKDRKWIHLGDRSLTQVGSEDEDFLAKASNAALEFAKNSTSQSSTPSATVMDDKVAEEVLGM